MNRPLTEPADRDVLDAALRDVPGFDRGGYVVEPLPGGLTNRSYRATPVAGAPVVVRVAAPGHGLLAIDRRAECHNADAAARSGAGPRVLACEPVTGLVVMEWVAGRTLCDVDLDDVDTITRVAATCRRLHAGPRCMNDFDIFETHERYLDLVRSRGLRMPERYRDYLPAVTSIRAALARHEVTTVPCHNDLVPANMIDDGERLWFIDYEYAGNGDPCFELGNLWSEAGRHEDRLADLVSAYYGRQRPSKVARARLLALMADYAWTLWATIQDAASGVGFDFRAWGLAKYERAVAEFDGAHLTRLVEDVQQPD